MISVRYDGREMTLEQALDQTMRDVQGGLNALHIELRKLAATTEQQLDDETDFMESVAMEYVVQDHVHRLCRLLEELPPIAADIRDKPPSAETRAWYVKRKEARKAEIAARTAAEKQQSVEEKAARAALKKASLTEGKDPR